ncbi:unnamed protein product [Urochloa decumbens]|uniref:C2H2-type domain-containing protein n=1 Tax=Urochloa decumbens TaxID=240449 RepID=A0ABC9ERI3_9POAL
MEMQQLAVAMARHGCKVCGKSFSSGRSLGGHMRSHLLPLGDAAAATAEVGDAADELVARTSADGGRTSDAVAGYGLRENPRKTRRLSDFAGDETDGGGDGERKSCQVCGKLFVSWRSLLEHMRGHASGGRDRDEDEVEKDAAMQEEFVPEAPPEAEEAEMVVMATVEAPLPAAVAALAAAPRRRRRTMRVAAPPPAPPPLVPCGFDKEPEPEDIALCLLMLSRDTGLWSSPVAVKQEPFESEKKRARLPTSGYAGNSDGVGDAKIKARVVPKGRKRSSPPTQQQVAPKRTRYECPGCGKVFGSYQALGGHRASHKRINTSCSAPKASSAAAAVASPALEPSAETYASSSTVSPSASPDSVATGFIGKHNAQAAAAVGKFECPICFVVFSSGKALGGHKLSHLVMPADGGELYAGGADQEHEQHSAGFLDLNFPPAPPEEA